MYISYEEHVTKYSSSFISILLEEKTILKIEKFVEDLIQHKSDEIHHKRDSNQIRKRFITGLCGEAALEKLLGIKIIDWTIGNSSLYHKPDIPGYKIGIKTVEQNKFPIIYKENYYPQIICIKSISNPYQIFICGLATKDVLNTYQSDNLILDPNLRKRNVKTGFYGFNHLESINSLKDIQKYKK